ncbi:D-alanyl-D-alanine carboxypeptidase/D-alanyl-D-alanine endopeptidase [Mesobacillus selenatarsenatis]|uniref:D-alanyl-D-alanine carboxypeptidase n=1 Tax=Mesobacillus selenatarsenatis (strain DSM 18680 / JCM 14380 / FERM P-15431 / SF-1) TaxID=1321606 RepID=A0A0A8XB71_MESS1|nr:D-alanyl-D-alanine carboxypeptidase/D-alanyl-D-alanine-endopeptidase [Mesobacillus selenatarsenatis]GAM16499.1 D-alanyl-D-alanine carboxypeptidase [Mesobacillus selenatarsenatis SF-1]
MKQKSTAIIIFSLVIIIAIIPFFHTEEPPARAVEPSGELSTEIGKLLTKEQVLDGALVGVSIRSAEDGKLLYEHIGDTRLQPASVLKMFTAAAAFSVLGEEYRFTTEVLADGEIDGGTLAGDLVLKGMGDPTLLPADLDEIALKLKNKGIKKVSGDLVADDSWYDDVRYSKDLTWNDEHQYYGAQVSALTASPNLDYDAATVIVNILPGKKGKAANISLEPETDYVKILNETVTVDPEGEHDIIIEREHGSNSILVRGTIPAGAHKEREWVAVWEPSLYAGSLFKKSLEDHGIKVVGKIITGRSTETMTRLISHKSMPLADLMIPFMKLSNNGHAEVLVKEMGKFVHGEGSWEKGLEVMAAELSRIGIDTSRLVLRDGSGISHANLIPANEITKLLYLAQKEKWFPAFQHSLPVAGVELRMVGGTMRNRLKEEHLKGRVSAKTGTLTGVSTLAGYVKTNSGETLIFSVLLNNLLDDREGRKVEDQIVRILSRQPL